MSFLLAAAVDDGGLDGGDDSSGVVAGLLERENDLEGLLVSDLAEDDVLAIEPAGHDGGDEELRAVAGENNVRFKMAWRVSARHTCGHQRWPWTEDRGGCASSGSSRRRTCHRRWSDHRYPIPREIRLEQRRRYWDRSFTHVAAGEVTTLEHEVGDDAVEGRALVTLTLLLVAELSEVLSGLGDNVVVQLEVDTAGDGA